MQPFPFPRLAYVGLSLLTGLLARPALAADYPPAVQGLVDRGVEIAGQFDAPGNTTGYVGDMQGQPVAFYLLEDGQHVIIGPMVDETGKNLTTSHLENLVEGPRNAKAWAKMEDSHWVRDGEADAPVIIYTFTDPNCPYCHRFRQAAAPWIDAGRVQLRHVLVGILRKDSLPKAATIFGADDPQEALRRNQENYGDGGITVNRAVISDNEGAVRANNLLMGNLGLSATPTIFYRADGTVHKVRGMPDRETLKRMMGSPKP